jgi:hypothetical protein
MVDTYSAAGFASGLAQAGEQHIQELKAAPERELRMKEARSRQQLSQMKLDDYMAVRPAQQDLAQQKLQNDLYLAQTEGLKQRTFDAFRSYDSDKNVKHLNNLLGSAMKNPVGRKLYGEVLRYDQLVRTPETEKMLRAAGVQDLDGFFATEDLHNMVSVTYTDGEQQIVDMDTVYAVAGYADYMTDQDLERLSKRALATQRLRQGESVQRMTETERLAQVYQDENPNMTKSEAYEKARKVVKGERVAPTTERERLAQQYMEADPTLTPVQAMEKPILETKKGGTARERLAEGQVTSPEDPVVQRSGELYEQEQRTVDQKKADEINEAKDKLDEQFNGDFLQADLSDPKEHAKASRLISRLEQEFPMTTEDRRTAVQVRQLMSLGRTAGEDITNEEAGLVDSMLRTVKSYVSNEVGGTKGTASYEAFRNVLRNAMFGATVSEGERNAFDDLKEKLTAVYDMNDPYVAKYRLGMSLDEIANVIGAIDERIELIDGRSSEGAITGGPSKPIAEHFKR